MPARTWTLLGTLLLAALAAGCTNGGDDDPGDTNTTPGSGGTPAPGNGTAPGATPEDFLLEESGSIQGPYSQSWNIPIENVAYTSASIHYEITGAQAGAPPTARVNVELADPDGNIIKSATLGAGGEGNAASWDLTPADTPVAGTYTLRAVAGDDLPVPSIGLASWTLHAEVTY